MVDSKHTRIISSSSEFMHQLHYSSLFVFPKKAPEVGPVVASSTLLFSELKRSTSNEVIFSQVHMIFPNH